MGLDEDKSALTWLSGHTQQSTVRCRSLGKEDFTQRNGDVSRGHANETKICRGEEFED